MRSTVCLVALACAPVAPVELAAHRTAGTESLADALQAFNLPADTILQEAGSLGTEAGFEVLRIPAFPEAGEPFRIAVIATSPRPSSPTFLHGSLNNFMDVVDVRGDAYTTPDGRPFHVWGPIRLPRDAAFAIRVESVTGDQWLDNGGANYSVPILAPASVSFAGRVATQQGGLTHDGHFAGTDLDLTVDTYPQGPGVSATVHWSVDGTPQPSLPLSIDAIDGGPFGNDTTWTVPLPTADLPVGSDILWTIDVDSAGPTLTVDDGGAPFRRIITAAPTPTWWQDGVYGWNRGAGAWTWSSPLPSPLGATPSDYQAYAFAPYPAIELYIPGISDQGVSPAALDLVQVEVWSPFFSGDPAAPAAGWPMRSREQIGNNLRYEWLPREFRAPRMPALGVECPVDGLYDYVFRVSTDGGRSWTELGQGGPTGTGSPFQMDWESFHYAPSLSLVPSAGPSIADTPVGTTSTAIFELVNTSSNALEMSDFAFDDPHYDLDWMGCRTGDCTLLLAPGERAAIRVLFLPTSAGAVSTSLSWQIRSPDDCTLQDDQTLSITATAR